MTLKAKMSLLVFLTSLSIVSIGFSSWSITAETTAEINGNIEVDDVKTDELFEIISVDKFTICYDGILQNYIISNSGYIKYNILLHLKNAREHGLIKDEKIELSTHFYSSNVPALISTNYIKSITLSYNSTTTNYTGTISNSTYFCSQMVISTSGIETDTLEFSISYNIQNVSLTNIYTANPECSLLIGVKEE